MDAPDCLLSVNRGSSSLKFGVYAAAAGQTPRLLLAGNLDRIGQADASLSLDNRQTGANTRDTVPAATSAHSVEALCDCIEKHIGWSRVAAVSHRIVHGGPRYRRPAEVSPELLTELKRISPFDPDHLPMEIELIESLAARFPQLLQVACFDTEFHRDMPRVARLLPIPRKYDREGVERYGFHGLSYEYLMDELRRRAGAQAVAGRVILAHLGAGASMAAVRDGRSIDTTMAFTPTAGLPMATRSGDLDPGLVAYFARTQGMNAEQFHEMVNHRSGLLGMSETSGDVRDLLAHESTDERAAEAIAHFCYQARKTIGALAAALSGLDILVFSAGIGEHSPEIRARICSGLEFLGVELDESANRATAELISSTSARVRTYVIPTDEQWILAIAAQRLLAERGAR